jgi:hypothetical protein
LLMQLHRSRWRFHAPETREKPNSLRESVNSNLWPFARQVLNIRDAIPGTWTAGTGSQRGVQSERSTARERLSDCPYSFARDAGGQSYFVAFAAHGVALLNTWTLTPSCDLTRSRIRSSKKRELSLFKSLIFP